MTSEARPKGRQARLQEARESTRRAILDAALDLFISQGYAQVSIRNIAARVEYSPGAIYGYFASKDEIFYALAEEGLRDSRRPRAGRCAECRSHRGRARVGVASLRVQQGPAAVLRAGLPGPPRAAREQGVRALRVHLRDAHPGAGARRALHRRRAVPGDDVCRGGAAAAVGAHRRHCGAAAVAPACPTAWTSIRWCATPSRRRLPAFAPAPRGMRGRSRPRRGRTA